MNFAKLSRKILPWALILIACMGSPSEIKAQTLSAQGSEQTVSYTPPVANLATNVPATNFNLIAPCVGSTCGPGANTFLLTTNPTITIRLSITNETANACLGSFVISVAASAQSSSSFNTQLQQWSPIALITSAGALASTVGVDLPANSTIYVSSTAISARNIAIQVINSTSACTSTNIDVTATLTTVSVTSPLISNTNGQFTGGLTANVQGIVPSGNNGAPVFPVISGAIQPATNALTATLGLDNSSQAQTVIAGSQPSLTVVQFPPAPSLSNEFALAVVTNTGNAAVTALATNYTCLTGGTCTSSNDPVLASASLVSNSRNALTFNYTNTSALCSPGPPICAQLTQFLLFHNTPTATRNAFNGNTTTTIVSPGATLVGSTLVVTVSCSTAACTIAPTDTQTLSWRNVVNTTAGSSVSGVQSLTTWIAGPSIASAETVTFNVVSGTINGSSFVELAGVNPASLNAPSIPNVAGSVSNGQWVNAGDVLWAQHTSQTIGAVSLHQNVRIILSSGTTSDTTWDVSCTLSSSGGFGTGFTVTTPGWLQSFTSYLATGGFPQGSDYINLYVLKSMPTGGGTSGCVNTLAAANIGQLLLGAPSGSSYPVSFVGTSAVNSSPWSIPGFTTVIGVGNPAVGTDWSFPFSGLGSSGGGARTCVQGIFFQLTTSATVANRTPVLRVIMTSSSGSAQMVYSPSTAQVAGATEFYSFTSGTTPIVTSGTTIYQTVPFNNGTPFCINSGLVSASISTLTTGLQAGDQFSNIGLLAQVQQDNN